MSKKQEKNNTPATKNDLARFGQVLTKKMEKGFEKMAIMINKHFATKNDLQDMKHEILEATKSTRNETLTFKDHCYAYF
tara:strand:+ start:80 stop:316 length:237 start_codon:yes stop_codon:yes gene_type:complete